MPGRVTECHAQAVRRPRGKACDPEAPRQGLEPAAVRPDRPEIVDAGTIRVETDAASIRRPCGSSVAEWVISESPVVRAIDPRDKQVLLLAGGGEDNPPAVGRELVIANRLI